MKPAHHVLLRFRRLRETKGFKKEANFAAIKFVMLPKGLAICDMFVNDERALELKRCCLKKV